jgi:membrane-associated protease RseP (regulator of RpoE activity)
MTPNMSSLDRGLRLLIGAVLVALALGLHDAGNAPQSGIWWAWIGVIPLATAFLNFCPLYKLLGISTCSRS